MIKKIFIVIFSSMLLLWSTQGIPEQSNEETDQKQNPNTVHEPIFDSNMFFRESGKNNKITVMLVHGIGEDASNIWNKLIPLLEEQFHVIAFDLPGFGRSDEKNVLYSPENYSLLIKWIYDKYINSPMYLIGHSMGGAISLYYAGNYPETIQRLVIADAAGILHGAALAKTLAKIDLGEISKYDIIRNKIESLNEYLESVIETTSEKLPKDISIVLNTPFLRKLFFSSSKKIASAALINTDLSRQIENARVPLFIIWGEKDPVAPLRTGKMLAFNISGSRLRVMPGLGHNPMLEEPVEFNNLIVKYLSDEIKFPENQPQPEKKQNIVLKEKEGLIINEVFGDIEISNCRNIIIRNVISGSVKINNSNVEFENVIIKSDKTGLSASDSDITITGGSFTCGVAFQLSNSNADLAGIKIEGKKAAVLSGKSSVATVIFSVCKIKSPYNDRYFHEVIEIWEDNPL